MAQDSVVPGVFEASLVPGDHRGGRRREGGSGADGDGWARRPHALHLLEGAGLLVAAPARSADVRAEGLVRTAAAAGVDQAILVGLVGREINDAKKKGGYKFVAVFAFVCSFFFWYVCKYREIHIYIYILAGRGRGCVCVSRSRTGLGVSALCFVLCATGEKCLFTPWSGARVKGRAGGGAGERAREKKARRAPQREKESYNTVSRLGSMFVGSIIHDAKHTTIGVELPLAECPPKTKCRDYIQQPARTLTAHFGLL